MQGREQPALELIDLVKTFGGGVRAVDHVSLAVQRGEILSILGPSGCGKTTTMRIMAGLEKPDSGDVRVDGVSILAVPVHKRNVGMVFQDLALFPHKNVRENVAFGLRMKGVRGETAERRVNAALEAVELSPVQFARRMPDELSGGQRQRVAVARTIAVEPALVLFDEPMAALDRRLRDRMALELRRIQKGLGVAAIYVTHDQETASMMSDRIAVMYEGRIVQTGAPLEVYREPANRFVADFLGDMNFIPADVDGAGSDARIVFADGSLPLSGHGRAGSLVMGVRPEQVRIGAERNADSFAQATVRSVHFSGGSFLHRLVLKDGTEIRARAASDETVGRQTVWLSAAQEDLRILDA